MDENIRVLGVEFNSLSDVLNSFSEQLNESSVSRLTPDLCTGYDQQHLEGLKRPIDDCQVTLKKHEDVFITAKGSGEKI